MVAEHRGNEQRDIQAIVHAMTAGQKRRYLAAAGWQTTTWLCRSDPGRLPERWYLEGRSDRCTLGQAIRQCLTAELGGTPAPAAIQTRPGKELR